MLSRNQLDTAIHDASIESLKEGKAPSLSRLLKIFQKKLPQEQATPTFIPRYQRWRELWDVKGMNASLQELDFDLRVLYMSLLEIGSSVLRRLNVVESSSRAQNLQFDRVENEIQNLLFLLQDGDGHFAGFFDDFSDLAKTNLTLSTQGVVDLSSQVLELPENGLNTKRFSLSHLTSFLAWPVDVVGTGIVLSSATATDAPFGNMFSDVLGMWRHDVVTDSPGPVSLSFIVPVGKDAGNRLTISRIQVKPLSEHEQAIEILWSNDNVNFLSFPGQHGPVDLEKSSRTVNLDFPPTTVNYLKFTLYRQTNDKAVDGGYLTSFGLSGLSLYSMGRVFTATHISKEFKLADQNLRAERFSISTLEEIPKGTSIDYFLGPIFDKDNDLEQPEFVGTWIPITPVGRAKIQDEAPREISMGTTSSKTVTMSALTPIEAYETFKGVNFYQLNEAGTNHEERLITDDVVYGSATLTRGSGAWRRNKDKGDVLFSVSGNYLTFSATNRQKLYVVSTETVPFIGPVMFQNKERTSIKVARNIDYRPSEGMQLTSPSLSPYEDPTPLYSLYEVTLVTATDSGSEALVLTGTTASQFTTEPIDTTKVDVTTTYKTAYKVSDNTLDTNLINELHSRATLKSYWDKIVTKLTISSNTQAPAGSPQPATIRYGRDSTTNYVELSGSLISSTPIPTKTKKTLSTLSDDALLSLFGSVTFQTPLISGVKAYKTSDSTVVYTLNTDFTLETVIQNGVTKLRAQRTTNSRITSGISVTFQFNYQRDLSKNVLDIDKNIIYLDRAFSFPSNSKIRVGYRYTPIGVNEVLPSSLILSPNPDGSFPYVGGKDYQFDASTGTVIRLPGGEIRSSDGGKTTAYAKFNYKGVPSSLETFQTWIFSVSKDPIRVEFQAITLDQAAGERFILQNGPAELDLTQSSVIIDLTYGWHQVTVISRSPDTYPDAAIIKVTQLQDKDDHYVFVSGNKYFSEVLGSRLVLGQVTYDYLKNSVLPKDDSKFAISSDGRVLVNFVSNSQQDYYTFGVRSISVGGVPTEQVSVYDETFTLAYRYRPTDSKRVNGVVIRTILNRSSDSDGDLTPKLFGLVTRVG